jgi:hypothetical protein
VKATPLNGGNDQPLARIVAELPPEMLVFSTDFPHFEGFADPADYFAGALAQSSAAERAAFAGGTMARVFADMGQPLTQLKRLGGRSGFIRTMSVAMNADLRHDAAQGLRNRARRVMRIAPLQLLGKDLRVDREIRRVGAHGADDLRLAAASPRRAAAVPTARNRAARPGSPRGR